MNSKRCNHAYLILVVALVQVIGQASFQTVSAAIASDDGENKIALAPLPPHLLNRDLRKLNELEKAYLDAYTILREENHCSRFFGGQPAVQVLTALVSQLKPTQIERTIAIRMSGRTTNYQSHRTGFSYRLFEKAEINRQGPFYGGNEPLERKTPLVSNYHSNSRATRLVALLHELGHLVRGTDEKWLLEDDGIKPELSVKNSKLVVDACHDEIDSITKVDVAGLLAASRDA